MDFGEALFDLKKGLKAYRTGWNVKGIFIQLQIPDVNSKMTHPYIFIDTTGVNNPAALRIRVPWVASQTDILSGDWVTHE